ncbi:MAG: formate--tetrahydrofolate ligase [Euryarchaeota archaeon]|nr:formate--tetrahydrofolate ligase [Euryarchaeota archaeon]
MKPINEIARDIGIENIIPFGANKAKIPFSEIWKKERKAKVILVTAINPTPYGEGKTTTSIGTSMALWKLGKRSIVTLREPSLGPVFGIKGGGTGGGKATVEPSDEINLHFTGDFHAIQVAHNLLSTIINNAMYHNLEPCLNRKKILWGKVLDLNARELRSVVEGLGHNGGATVENHFEITSASEISAIIAIAKSYTDLKERLSNILVGFRNDKSPVFAKDFNVVGAMAAVLRDALLPNLVQTSEGTPAVIHGGPFANIAHGHNSILADEVGMRYSDYLVTEAGFGSDLGAEKFVNIVSRLGDFEISGAVLVATVKALKYHGGVKKKHLNEENVEAMEKGAGNLQRHIEIVRKLGFEPVVAINHFPQDSEKELARLQELVEDMHVKFAVSEVFAQGGEGGIDIAKKLIDIEPRKPNYTYKLDAPVREKVEAIATEIYGADGVVWESQAKKDLKLIDKMGFNDFYICMAKTQYSLSDNPKLLGSPEGFVVHVRSLKISSGARFIVPMLGDISTMPGLPSKPAAENIDLTDDGQIVGLR